MGLDEMKRKGKIRHAGFPFHGGVEVFKKIIDNYDWGMCQIELNYLPCFIPTVNNVDSVNWLLRTHAYFYKKEK